jgi:glycosyltransferase involved in cell wall biosynthesis
MTSFIICSHTAPPTLFACLESIAAQSRDAVWEVVVVNNGFSAEAEQRIVGFAAEHGMEERLCIVEEPTPGLGFARRRGFEAARGGWFVLLDDDNTIAPDFCTELDRAIAAHEGIGGITPAVIPAWEKEPPEWLAAFGVNYLSYNAPGSDWPSQDEFFPAGVHALRPPGGGMIVHRSVVAAYLARADDPFRLALARTRTSLVGCEDHDLWRSVSQLRMAVLVSARLRVWHHIPASRLLPAYLLRLTHAMAWSYTVLRRLDAGCPGPDWPRVRAKILSVLRLAKMALFSSRHAPLLECALRASSELGDIAGEFKRLPR